MHKADPQEAPVSLLVAEDVSGGHINSFYSRRDPDRKCTRHFAIAGNAQ